MGPAQIRRPEGGNGRILVDIGEDGSGGLLTVLQDNNLMRAFVDGADNGGRGFSTFDYVVVRTSTP